MSLSKTRPEIKNRTAYKTLVDELTACSLIRPIDPRWSPRYHTNSIPSHETWPPSISTQACLALEDRIHEIFDREDEYERLIERWTERHRSAKGVEGARTPLWLYRDWLGVAKLEREKLGKRRSRRELVVFRSQRKQEKVLQRGGREDKRKSLERLKVVSTEKLADLFRPLSPKTRSSSQRKSQDK